MHGRGRPPVRVAIVTLDNHLKGAVERASAELAADNVALTLHAASDWEREDGAYERTLEAIEHADIIIATMLFLDDHIRMVLPALEARREAAERRIAGPEAPAWERLAWRLQLINTFQWHEEDKSRAHGAGGGRLAERADHGDQSGMSAERPPVRRRQPARDGPGAGLVCGHGSARRRTALQKRRPWAAQRKIAAAVSPR